MTQRANLPVICIYISIAPVQPNDGEGDEGGEGGGEGELETPGLTQLPFPITNRRAQLGICPSSTKFPNK